MKLVNIQQRKKGNGKIWIQKRDFQSKNGKKLCLMFSKLQCDTMEDVIPSFKTSLIKGRTDGQIFRKYPLNI